MGEKQQKKIFVVEQEAFLARIILRGLTRAGYETRHLNSGDMALASLEEHTPLALVVANDMTPMSGEEFCRRLQLEYPDRSYPVFIMTDSAQDMQPRWSHWFSNFRMVDKPISLRSIIESLDKLQEQIA